MILTVDLYDGLERVLCSYCGNRLIAIHLLPEQIGSFISDHAIQHGKWGVAQTEP